MSQNQNGTAGDDILTGTSPNDPGNPDGIDYLDGLAGDDILNGEGGVDWLTGGPGADSIDGGSGQDILRFSLVGTAVTVNLATGMGTGGDAAGDTYTSIEVVYATNANDTLTGNATSFTALIGQGGDDILTGGSADDTLTGDYQGGGTAAGVDSLFGGDGNDMLMGGDKGDLLDGGNGIDRATYDDADATQGVSVSLQTGAGRGGYAEGDTLVSIEELLGTGFADTLAGDSGDNYLNGRNGNDLLMGAGGADTLIGDDGIDTALYRDSAAGVTVNLVTDVNTGGDAQGDSLFAIENVSGSAAHGDTLTGDGEDNRLDGMGGDDVLSGGNGNDTLLGRDGQDSLSGGAGDDTLQGGAGIDTLDGGDGADRLQGGDGDDTLTGGAGTDQLYSGAGADLFAFTSLDGSTDRIRDWAAGDRVQISLSGFGIAGAVSVESGTSAHGLEGDVFFYHTTTGRLFFHDGDTGTRTLFAVITAEPASLSLSDFSLV